MKVFLADEAAVADGRLTEVDFFGRPAVLFKQDGQVKSYLNVCTHLGGPLKLTGETLQCQWHEACFQSRNGLATRAPAPAGSRLIRLPIRVEDGKVFYVYGD